MTSGERVDVLVIGAGASGAAVAWMLARAGIGVTCLEQGDWVDPKAYPHWQPDWELRRHTDWSPEPNVRRLPQDYPVNDAASPIAPLMYNAVGGSTIHWSAHFPRLRPSDFRVRSLDGVADDWPVDYAALEPFFDLNDRMMGVAGIAGDPAYPPKSPRQTPPIVLDTLGVTIARGFDRLGWHWWPSDSAIITRDYDGRRACNNCGPCDLGCPIGAKASTDVTYWPKALALGARLVTQARVREITVGPDGRADGVALPRSRRTRGRAEGARGRARRQRHRHTAAPPQLALGAIPRRARQPQRARGAEPHVPSLRDRARRLRRAPRRPPGPHRLQHHQPGVLRDRSRRGASCAATRSRWRGGSRRSRPPPADWWATACRGAASTGGHTTSRFDRTIGVAVIGEDLPEAHNRVDLDPGLTDSHGIPAPRVSYTLERQ